MGGGYQLELKNFHQHIYFKPSYAELYGEVFIFKFQEKDFFFQTIAIKNPIPNSAFYDISSPYGYSGIYTNTQNTNFLHKAFEKLSQQAKKENIIAFFLRLHPFSPYIDALKNFFHFHTINKEIILVPIALNPEQIRRNYSVKIRNSVIKAREKLNIDFCTLEDLPKFQKLYHETMSRNKADQFYYFDEKYFKSLFKLPESVFLKASLENEILAFACFFLYKDISYYHLSANSLKENANSALLDFFFEYAHKQDSQICILGGGLKDHDSLYNFKKKFSRLKTNFEIAGLVFDEKNYQKICQNYANNKFLKYRY
ncbi:hypothetical protein LS280_000332 [Campylobacter jejuni]|nr:hypothetical protein [Campylobacter jejuni]